MTFVASRTRQSLREGTVASSNYTITMKLENRCNESSLRAIHLGLGLLVRPSNLGVLELLQDLGLQGNHVLLDFRQDLAALQGPVILALHLYLEGLNSRPPPAAPVNFIHIENHFSLSSPLPKTLASE